MPEKPIIEEGTEFPDKLPDNLIEYPVYVDFDSIEDQTAVIEEQLKDIPNGTPEQYVAIVFHGKFKDFKLPDYEWVDNGKLLFQGIKFQKI